MEFLLGCIYRPLSAPVSFCAGLDEDIENVLRLERKHPVLLLLTGDLNVDVADFFKSQADRQNGEYETRKKSRGQIEETFRPGASSVVERATFLAKHNLANHVKAPTRYSVCYTSQLPGPCSFTGGQHRCIMHSSTSPHFHQTQACLHCTNFSFNTCASHACSTSHPPS